MSSLPHKSLLALIEKNSANLAEEIKKLRMEGGISRNELAQRSGTSRHTVTEIEVGNSQPTIGTLMKIVYALDTNCARIFDRVEEDPETQNIMNEDSAPYSAQLDESFEKALAKLRRKAKKNPDLRATVLELAKLQVVYHKG